MGVLSSTSTVIVYMHSLKDALATVHATFKCRAMKSNSCDTELDAVKDRDSISRFCHYLSVVLVTTKHST